MDTAHTKDEAGFMVKSLLIVLALVALGVVAYKPVMHQIERLDKRVTLENRASDGLAAVQRAVRDGDRRPARAAQELSDERITLNATVDSEQSFCVVAQWNDPAAGLDPVYRGNCVEQE